jgi:hypothetical protein
MKRLLVLVPFLFAACAADTDQEDVGFEQQEGVSLNGVSLNGVSLNGVSLNGVSLNGVSLNGVSLNGVSLNGVSLNGTVLGGSVNGGSFKSGSQLVGSSWTGVLSNGTTLAMKMNSVTTGNGANTDVYMYGISYLSSGVWTLMCGKDANSVPILAIPVKGTFNYASGVVGGGSFTNDATKFTFGCRGTAIAKCVEMGYKPWKAAATATGNLTNHHVACTRLLRADYCGDGTPYTVNGTQVNIYDSLGIQADTMGWAFEGEWTPTGARCVSPGTPTRVQRTLQKSPACLSAKLSYTCGQLSDFSAGALIMSETL